MNSNKTFNYGILIISVLVLGLLLFGCSQPVAPAGGEEEVAPVEPVAAPAERFVFTDLNSCFNQCDTEYRDYPETNGNYLACKFTCHLLDANNTKDVKKCEPLISHSYLASDNGVGLFGQVSNYEYCLVYLGGEMKDTAPCDEFKRTPELCAYNYRSTSRGGMDLGPGCFDEGINYEQSFQDMREACYARVADQLNDPAICEKITSEITSDQYYNECIHILADDLNDPSLCDKTRLRNLYNDEVANRESYESDKRVCVSLANKRTEYDSKLFIDINQYITQYILRRHYANS